MPLYEYTCSSCQSKFEKLVRSPAQADKPKCPDCGSTKTARALSLFAVGAPATPSRSPSQGPGCGRCGGPNPCGID